MPVFGWHFAPIAVAGAARVAATRRRASDALLVAGFGLLAFLYVRNLTIFALATFGPVCVAVAAALRRIPRLRLAAPAAFIAAVVLLVASPTWAPASSRAASRARPRRSSSGTGRRAGSSTSSTPAATSRGGSCRTTRSPSTGGTTTA
jgi:hypothetical protein